MVGGVSIITNHGYKISLQNVHYCSKGRCAILSIQLLQFAQIHFKLENFRAHLYYLSNNKEMIVVSGDSVNDVSYKFFFQVLWSSDTSYASTMITENLNYKCEALHQK